MARYKAEERLKNVGTGRTTALAVNILTSPTHIAGLPVAVNVSCHVTRRATAVL